MTCGAGEGGVKILQVAEFEHSRQDGEQETDLKQAADKIRPSGTRAKIYTAKPVLGEL